jgi:nitrogen fixation/metabolism regulation signal transduction histidine kinase
VHLARTQVLETQGAGLNGRVAHWEIATVVTAAVLAGWLRSPHLGMAAGALVAGVAAAVLAARSRRLMTGVAIGATVLFGVGIALRTSARVAKAETAWDPDSVGVRWRLVAAAGRRLDTELARAVADVRTLAEAGSQAAGRDRDAAFSVLADAVGRGGPERGVMVFDSVGRPWAWGGRHRMSASNAIGLEVRITPFYAVLSAGRQSATGRRAVAHVLLAADSVVPDAHRALAEGFARASGVRLEVFPPGGGPQLADVFDYCVPACTSRDIVPDTLFSVRLVPPTQGAYRRWLVEAGTARVAGAAAVLLIIPILLGGVGGRALGVAGLGAALVFGSVGRDLPFGRVFSPATYYADLLGPFSASGGALIVVAVLVTVAIVGMWERPWRVRAALGAAFVVILGAPVLLRRLATGITPPIEGADARLWMAWQFTLAAAGAAVLIGAAALARFGKAPRGTPWTAVAAVVGSAALAGLALAVWMPRGGWPAWHTLLWCPVFALAILPAGRLATVALVALASGTYASALVWGAAADGRVLQADRDAEAVRQGSDPIALGLLERFGGSVEQGPPPRTAAELYQRWQRSPLEADRYPAVLGIWDSAGTQRVRLALADLASLTPELVRGIVLEAGTFGIVVIEGVSAATDVHYVLAVPMRNGRVLSVGLGPRTQMIRPVRVARFLRGERVLSPPYGLSVGPVLADEPSDGMRWGRDGRVARGEVRTVMGTAMRRIVAEVSLGTPGSLFIRGTLVVVADFVLLVLLWGLGEHVAGRRVLTTAARGLLGRRSYQRRLAVAFAVFFVVPTVAFAAWLAARLREEGHRSRDVATRQILAEAAGDARTLAGSLDLPEGLQALSGRLDAELLLYDRAELRGTSAPILAELGVVDWYLAPDVVRSLGMRGDLEADMDQWIAGRPTRVGYRKLEVGAPAELVLAVPRLLEDPATLRNEQDVIFGLLVVTLGGLVAALGLAAVAARTLATPVQALQRAAEQVGRGELPSPISPDAPGEFAPVMEAFDRMAADVRRSQAALEAARQRTAAVLRNVATGVVALDDAWRIVTSNPRAEELLGVILHAGDVLEEVSPPTWAPLWGWVAAVSRGADDSEPREFAIGDRQIRAQVAPLVGAARGWVVALDDVTDLSRVVRVLAWGELARQIAHEIKNPLTPIRLGVQHLQRAYEAPRGDFGEVLDHTSRQILAEIERLDAVARAFSRFGAPPAGQEPLARVDAAAVAQDTAALYALGEQGRVVVTGARPLMVRARPDELKEVLINLVENARAAGAANVAIRLSDGTESTIAVEDDGPGIAAADLPRVLDPQFSTTTSGAGLGLTICRRLVESWDGRISVESSPGRGTTVRLVLRSAGERNGGMDRMTG